MQRKCELDFLYFYHLNHLDFLVPFLILPNKITDYLPGCQSLSIDF